MMAARQPDVSVIVCTRDRPALLPRALASVRRSAALVDALIEVIVIDDGDEPVRPPLARGAIAVLPGPRAGVGAARATGLAAARGELIAYCDDDDQWTPEHLSLLLAAFRHDPGVALVHGDAGWRVADPALPAAPPVRLPALGAANRIHASDVLHRASAARDVGGFDRSLSAYEDIDLWLRIDEAHRLRHLPAIVTLHDRHRGCVTAVEHGEARDRVLRHHRQARPGRESAPAATAPSFDLSTWTPPRRELLWHSPLNPYQGFGVASRELLGAVERSGVEVRLAEPPGPTAPEFARLYKRPDRRQRLTFRSEYWHQPDLKPTGLQVITTMREDTLVPRARINALNQSAALVYLPCRQNLESFRACGLRVPSKVLPFGIDPERFPLLDRPRSGTGPFTFGTFGALTPRKGIDILIRAFIAAFRPGEPVRLLIKSVDPLPVPVPAGAPIELLSGFWDHERLLSFLRQLDVFVLPSRGEGFGLCGLESMATGLPLIATNWSGPADYLDPADSFPLAYRLVDAGGTEANGVRYFGAWAEPEIEHLAALMRRLYEHPDEARAKGRQASMRVHAAWTWERPARQLRDDLDLLACDLSPA